MARRPQTPLAAAFATIIILIALLVFLLVYDDLRTKLWIQGMSGVIMALIVAVVLFAVLNSVLHVKNANLWGGIVGGGGAVIFYLLVLPQIKPFFFPTHALSGYVYFKQDNPTAPLTPVAGVVAEIPTTGQKSAATDDSGRFVLDGVYADETNLQLQYAGKTYPVVTTNYPNSRYPVIERAPVEPQPNRRAVGVAWQSSPAYKCDLQGYTKATGFMLTATLTKDGDEMRVGAKRLHLKVTLPTGFGDLTQPDAQLPPKSIDFVEVNDVDTRNQGWEWDDIQDKETKVKVAICVNSKTPDREVAATDFQTIYWYGVMK